MQALVVFLAFIAGFVLIHTVGSSSSLHYIFSGVRRLQLWILRPRRQRKIREQWPEALVMMAGALRTGATLGDALTVLTEDSPEPLRSHVASLLREPLAWLPMRQRVLKLMEDPSLALPRASLLLSQQVGGKEAKLLVMSARLLRQDMERQLKMETLTAQSRWTAWVVGLSPFGLLVGLGVVSPELVEPFFLRS